jgi:hypothetical protein
VERCDLILVNLLVVVVTITKLELLLFCGNYYQCLQMLLVNDLNKWPTPLSVLIPPLTPEEERV